MFSNVFTRKRDQAQAAQPERAIKLLPHFQKIVVPAFAAPYSQRALKTACRMASMQQDTEIRLVYLMEVPRAFALAAALPGEEALADSVLSEGASIIESFGCRATADVQRGRDVVGTLLKYLAQQDIDLLILGSRPDGVRGMPLALARDIYDRAPCRVILDHIAGDRQSAAVTLNEEEQAAVS